MPIPQSEHSSLGCIVATAAVVAASSYYHRWTNAETLPTVVVRVIDLRQDTPTAKVYALGVNPLSRVVELLDAITHVETLPVHTVAKDTFTVFLSSSAQDVELYFNEYSPPASRAVMVLLGSESTQPSFHPLPSPYPSDAWLPERCTSVFSALLPSSPSIPLGALPIVGKSEHDALLKLGQNAEQPSEIVHQSLHHYFEEVVRTSPQLPALAFDSQGTVVTLTYGEMNQRCSALAAHLAMAHNVGRGDMVPLFFSRGLDMVIAIFAVLKTGAAYVPLDIEHPKDRTATIVSAIEGRLVLTESQLAKDVRARVNDSVVVVAIDALHELDTPDDGFNGRGNGDDLAYVLFTSGTTGTPKGVMLQHSAVVSSVVDGLRDVRRRDGCRVFLSSNYAFDFSVWDIFIPLSSGGCVCIAKKEDTFDDLNGILRRLSVNIVWATQTFLSLIDQSELPSLNTIGSGGEMLTELVRDRVFKAGRQVINIYGPTETAVCCILNNIDPTKPDVTVIGRPFGLNRVYILDNELRLVPRGAIGTLWIAGPQVSKGYLGRPDLTAAVFLEDPFFHGETMYNSGDLCSWSDGGELRCHGRADQQVKIRGQRIEIFEIENTMTRVDGVNKVCVVKRVRDGHEDLVAFFQTVFSLDVKEVESHIVKEVRRSLPAYMHPSVYVCLPKMPVTTNGKIDRKLLAQQALQLKSAIADTVAPAVRTEMEAAVARCWSEVLRLPVDSIPNDSDFYECGGDSISTIRLAVSLRASGISAKTSDLRIATTVATQATLLGPRSSDVTLEDSSAYLPLSLIANTGVTVDVVAGLVGCGSEAIEDVYPCTSSVSGLVSLASANPQSYFAQHAFRRATPYDPDCLFAAWNAVVTKHPLLRTTFVLPPSPTTSILQVVMRPDAFKMSTVFHYMSPNDDAEQMLEKYLKSSRQAGFHLGIVPTRFALFQGASSSTMVLQVHHSQYDGWSLPIILEDLQKAYASSDTLSIVALSHDVLPFSHFVRWTRQQSTSDALTFWASELEDAVLPSWPKVPRDTSVATDTLLSVTWSPPAQFNFAQFCKEHKTTASSLIRLALAVVLGIHGNTDDVLFGVVTSGRSGDLPGVESVVGPCIATLPFRLRLPRDARLGTILADIQQRSLSASAFEYVGLSDIINSTQFTQSRTIFQVLLTVENIPDLNLHDHPFFGEDVHGHQMEMDVPLSVTVFLLPDNQGLTIDIEYDSHHLSSEDIRWFKLHLLATLDALMRSSSSTLAELNIVAEEELAFLQQVGIGLTPDPILAAEPLMHQLFEKIAMKHPERIAVEHTSGHTLTYAALDSFVNRAAHGLRSRGVITETPVPVLFDKDQDQTEAVIAILAVMKAGGAFVPLDISWPSARIHSCVRQCAAPFVVCSVSVPSVARELLVPFATVDELAAGNPEARCADVKQGPNSLAYIIFTSGSTGEPKGVMIEHRNIMGYVANGTTVYPILDVKRLLHFSPFSFDQGLGDIFMALTKGVTLLLANMSDVLTDLSSVLNTTRADYTVLTPAIAQLIRSDVEHLHLKSLLVGGEKLPGQLVDRWKGKVAFMDDYGPTEVTVSCVGMTFKADTQAAAGVIGSPYGDTRAYIVDPDDITCLVPVGAVGELCLSGNQVGRGYLNRPDLTAASFVPDPFAPGLTMYRSGDRARWTSSGFIEYLGRQSDTFVKLRGLRIDVSESEDAITGAGDTFSVVELLELRGQPHLVAFVSRALANSGETAVKLAPGEGLRSWLLSAVQACREAVPAYAVPTIWVALEAMPQNSNSKFDKNQLRKFFDALDPAEIEAFSATLVQTQAPRAPETAVEKAIARVWCDVLRRDIQSLSVHDDFFMMGGDSISVVRALAGLKALGLVVPLKDFAAKSSIAELSAQFEDVPSPGNSTPESSLSDLPSAANGLVWQVQASDENATPLWMIHDGGGLGNEYKNMTSLKRPVYAVSNPTSTLSELRESFPSYESYVSAYTPLISAQDGVYIGGWSVGGAMAISIAARLIAAGQQIKGIVLIDSYNYTGWGLTPSCSDKGFDPEQKLSADNFVLAHQEHVDALIGQFSTKPINVPVLLIHGGVRTAMEEIERVGFVVPFMHPNTTSVDSGIGGLNVGEKLDKDADDRRLWPRDILPNLEIVTIKGADHFTLMRDKVLCAQVSVEVTKWLARVDQ